MKEICPFSSLLHFDSDTRTLGSAESSCEVSAEMADILSGLRKAQRSQTANCRNSDHSTPHNLAFNAFILQQVLRVVASDLR